MLRRIGLTNFKCWRELDMELAPITLLFGTNSSGKTAILQSLLMLKQTFYSIDQSQYINFGGGPQDYVDLGSYRDLVHSHDSGRDIGARLTWEKTGEILSRKARAIYPGDPADRFDFGKTIGYEVEWRMRKAIFVNRLAYSTTRDSRLEDSYSFRRKDDGSYALWMDGSRPDSELGGYPPPLSSFSLTDENGMSFTNYGGEFYHLMSSLQYMGPLRGYSKRHYLQTGSESRTAANHDVSFTISNLIGRTAEKDKLAHKVGRELESLGLADGFEVRPIDANERVYEVVVSNDGVESALLDVGFGVSQVLPIIVMLLSAPKGSIVLLEQPELHLHPGAQAAMADLMLQAAETRGFQLIVESHSEHILRRLQRRMAEASTDFARPENIKLYFCQPGEDGSTAEEVIIDRFGQISNWPENFLGDLGGDIHNMSKAAFKRLRAEKADG